MTKQLYKQLLRVGDVGDSQEGAPEMLDVSVNLPPSQPHNDRVSETCCAVRHAIWV